MTLILERRKEGKKEGKEGSKGRRKEGKKERRKEGRCKGCGGRKGRTEEKQNKVEKTDGIFSRKLKRQRGIHRGWKGGKEGRRCLGNRVKRHENTRKYRC